MSLMKIIDGPEVVGAKVEEWDGDSVLAAMADAYTEPVPDETEVKRRIEREQRIKEAHEPFSPPYKDVMLMSKSGSLAVLRKLTRGWF